MTQSVYQLLAFALKCGASDVHLSAGDFTTTVLRARSDYGFSPRMFASVRTVARSAR